MREGIMSAGFWTMFAGTQTPEKERSLSPAKAVRPEPRWDPERFEQEQVRGLVRQVFCTSGAAVRQVVFSASEQDADVHNICMQVGQMLATETQREVAVVAQPRAGDTSEGNGEIGSLRQNATRVGENLWLVADEQSHGEHRTAVSVHTYLGAVRRQFEYSIVEAPPAGESSEATALAQFADGMILVLSAERTRRAAARGVCHALEAAHVRLLGAVLGDRDFPIPEGIYRRL
jgi:receptor protein-tyrosine kinase